MSLRIDTSEWIADALLIGETGLGVTADNIPAGGYAYNDLSLPADTGKEICGRITAWPSAGTLVAQEDTRFVFSGPDGYYTFQYQLYVDGGAVGSPVTVELLVGIVGHAGEGSLAADDATMAGAASRIRVHTADGQLASASASLVGIATRAAGGGTVTLTPADIDAIAAAVWAYGQRTLTADGNTGVADAVWSKTLP